jgi:hypothetical protein
MYVLLRDVSQLYIGVERSDLVFERSDWGFCVVVWVIKREEKQRFIFFEILGRTSQIRNLVKND